MTLRGISAITLAVRDMARSVAFYQRCGLNIAYGGAKADFTSLHCGESFVNLILTPEHQPAWWGRVILHVESANDCYAMLKSAGLSPDEPQDAPWGERYFHITDPDGHEVSFAEPMRRRA